MSAAVHTRELSIAAPGAELVARLFEPETGATGLPVLLCGATGVRQRFYTAFAEWLCEQGHPVMSFDYRGIGDSLHGVSVRNSRVRKQDWGELDMPAALDTLLTETGVGQAVLLGHSAGGQLVGLMPNHARLAGVVAVSGSSGYVANLYPRTRWAARLLFGLYMPMTGALLGYVPARIIGWGEDLPRGVARQWGYWCSSPGYVENDFGKSIAQHYYAEIQVPIVALNASDDPIATPANIDDLLRLFPNAPQTKRSLQPHRFGLARIGHIDMFRRRCSVLWPEVLAAIRTFA